MERAVDDVDIDIDDRVAADDAVEHAFLDALDAGRDVFLRDTSAHDLVLDSETLAALVGLDLDDDVAVLTASAGLLDQFSFAVGRGENGFLVGDLRFAGVRLDLELAHHAVADNFEVQLAHARDDRLAGFLVGEDAESRVFLGEALQCDTHLFLVDFGLRLDGHGNDRLGEGRRLEKNRMVFVAERVARGDVLDTNDGRDVARVTRVNVLALVGLDLDESADALAFAGARIVDVVAFGKFARVDAEENEFADERIAPELESERREIAAVIGRDFDRRGVIRVLTADRRNVQRAREVIDDGVDEILHALVFESGTAGDGDEFVGDGLAADGGLEVLLGDRFFLEEHHADFLVEIGHLGDEVIVSFAGDFLVVLGNFRHLVGRAHHVIVRIKDGLLVDDVDLSAQVVLFAERNKDRPDIGAELGPHAFDGGVEVRAGAVHLVDESDARDVVFGRLAPDGFGLRLHAGHAAEYGDGAVKHTERTLHLGREVHVARGVDDVDALVDVLEQLEDVFLRLLQPGTGGGGGGDGDAALALLLHPVGNRRALVHLADLVDHAGVKKDTLGQRGLARVDVRADADVARALERERAVGRIRIRGGGCGGGGGHEKERVKTVYQRKWAKARLAWAILCISSRFLMALPCPAAASLSSMASASFIGTALRLAAKVTSQRMASAY